MQLLAEQTIGIGCSVEAAYGYTSNLERFGDWFPGVIAIEAAHALGHAQRGKEYLETVAVPFRGTRKIRLVVKEAEPNRLLVTEGAFPPLMPRMEIRFQASGAQSCQVTWRMFSRNNSLLARATVLPIARSVMGKRAVNGMARLKQNLESSHEPARPGCAPGRAFF